MLRIIGAVIIILSCGGLGFLKSHRLYMKKTELAELICCFEIYKNEVDFGKRDTKTIFTQIGDTKNNSFFKDAASFLAQGMENALEKSAEKNKGFLDKSELCAIAEFSKGFGIRDTKSQTGAIEHLCKALEAGKEQAANAYRKCGKLYKSMGILGGFAAVIILL